MFKFHFLKSVDSDPGQARINLAKTICINNEKGIKIKYARSNSPVNFKTDL